MQAISQFFGPVKVPDKATSFKMPIEYLPNTHIYTLAPTVLADLELNTVELAESKLTVPMYFYAMQPKNVFAETISRKWMSAYTTNIPFLKDSQAVIRSIDKITHVSKLDIYVPDCVAITRILTDLERSKHFMDDYSYVDIAGLDIINQSAPAMQAISVVNLGSPIMSFLMPIAVMLAPFFVLKMKGESISFTTYLSILRIVAGNHFIGHTIEGMRCLSIKSILYTIALTIFYIMQMYTNTMICLKYYANIQKLTTDLITLRDHIIASTAGMIEFVRVHSMRSSFTLFCEDISRHATTLTEFGEKLSNIVPFSPNLTTFSRIGDIMTLYYEPRTSPELIDALHTSCDFLGYVDNLRGISQNIKMGKMQFASFGKSIHPKLKLKNQRYPPHTDKLGNTCSFKRNMVLTGPNASGKTTLIKATCINIIFSQQFACGFYDNCIITPFTHIHSYLNIPDSSGRDSLFQAESRRCLEIMMAIHNAPKTETHFCIFDELYSGTNPDEAISAGNAFLTYLSKLTNVRFMLTTHYTAMCEKLNTNKHIANNQMSTLSLPNGNLKFLYQIKKGISYVHGAANILTDLGYPPEIIDMVRKDANIISDIKRIDYQKSLN